MLYLHESTTHQLFLSTLHIYTPNLFIGYTSYVSFMKSLMNTSINVKSHLSLKIRPYFPHVLYRTFALPWMHLFQVHYYYMFELIKDIPSRESTEKPSWHCISKYSYKATVPSFINKTKEVVVLLLLYYSKNSLLRLLLLCSYFPQYCFLASLIKIIVIKTLVRIQIRFDFPN